jgi:hypothetical protein
VKAILGRFEHDERERATKDLLGLFVDAFVDELKDKTPLTSAIPGYCGQLKRLIEHAAPDIAAWLQPETTGVDLGPVQRLWGDLGLDPLPEGFEWSFVAGKYARGIRAYVREHAGLRDRLNTVVLEVQAEAQKRAAESLSRIAGPEPGFDEAGYRDYIWRKCEVLQLSAMHTSSYERRIRLWSVFEPQSARESAPERGLSPGVLRRARDEAGMAAVSDEIDPVRERELYDDSDVSPVLEILARQRTTVVLEDPGSGKTSLLMRWLTEAGGPLPVWIELRHYGLSRQGFVDHCQSATATYRLDARELDKRFRTGEAVLYLDALDEVFDASARAAVVEEIAAFASRYPEARIVVTSRVIGYEPDRL